jgi:hypothetical protein
VLHARLRYLSGRYPDPNLTLGLTRPGLAALDDRTAAELTAKTNGQGWDSAESASVVV